MRVTVLFSNGEAQEYYGQMKITDGVLEIKTENPMAAVISIPLVYVEEYRRE